MSWMPITVLLQAYKTPMDEWMNESWKSMTYFLGSMADKTNTRTMTLRLSGGNGKHVSGSATSQTKAWHRWISKFSFSYKMKT